MWRKLVLDTNAIDVLALTASVCDRLPVRIKCYFNFN